MAWVPVLFAQWAPYPTPGIPRTADGKPNLSAPAPKTADGKPDLTGIWENFRAPAPAPAAAANPKAPAANGDFFSGLKTNDDFPGSGQEKPILEHRLFLPGRFTVPALGRGTAQATRRRQ